MQIFDSRRSDATGGAPGEVIAVSDDGITGAASGGAILVQRVRPEGDKKIASKDFVAGGGVAVGSKFV